MVIPREWEKRAGGGGGGEVEMSSSRNDSTRVDTTRYFKKSTPLEALQKRT